jgi:hypothetical protein
MYRGVCLRSLLDLILTKSLAKDTTCKQGYQPLECCKFIESTLYNVIRR